ncbi:MAG: response regulator receiver modulated serine phosphatase [Acidobacteriales bacterium]|nr:response regulator receiver modulated serine phosphatase [Terriglobales bacterium]
MGSVANLSKGEIAAERPRILVAEDQEDVIEALRLLLKVHGYDAEFVDNPADALVKLKSSRFDGMLMDLNYSRDTTSGTEGLHLLTEVQALDSTLAIVVMTAWGSIELAVDAMHRGACDFVQKPWDNTQLIKTLSDQLKRSKALRARFMQEQFESEEAAEVQRALMSSGKCDVRGFSIATFFRSVRNVGGDYYDVIGINENRMGLCIGDVVGKGVGAALLMSNLQAAVRTAAPQAVEPKDLCTRVNRVICANKVPGKFITFCYCILDSEKRTLQYTNAGHNAPMLVRANGEQVSLSGEDSVLGTFAKWDYHQHQLELCRGDRLVLFTDGITESTDGDDIEFGEDALAELIAANVQSTADELKTTIMEAVVRHNGGRYADDATLIVIGVE